MKKKLTILFLVNGFGVGGAEKALLELVKRINRDQFQVLVASVGQGGILEQEFRNASEQCFVFRKKFSFDFSLIPKVAALLRLNQVDILLTTLFYADVIGTFAARMVGTPVKMSWQTALAIPTGNVEDDRWRHIVAYRAAASQMTHIVAVSHEVRNYFIRNRHIPPQKISTIHYGVDLNRFQKSGKTIRKELGLSDQDVIISVVGHLSDVKGHTFLLKASPFLIRKNSRVQLVFAGDGPEKASLEQEAKTLGIREHVHFLGVRSDVPDILRSSDIFVLPSIYEGLPNVILEAMASGLPVVASRVGGIPEAVADGETGFLFPAGDSTWLEQVLAPLIRDGALRRKMGEAGRKRVENHFSIDVEVRSFQDLFQTLYFRSNGKKQDSK